MSRAKNQAEFYYIEVKPTAKYKTFRTLRSDGGETSGIERVVGQRADGVWETVKWLVGKDSAHVAGERLVADDERAKELFARFGSEPQRIEGNRFKARERAPEKSNKAVKSVLF